MKCLVTGGNGFIGRNVVKALKGAGHEVIVLDLSGQAEFQVDICLSDEVLQAFSVALPDVVFHIAAIADARKVIVDPILAVRVNVLGTLNVLEAARQIKVQRVIIASTGWLANAMQSPGLDEAAPLNPAGGGHIYTTSKIASEMLAHDYAALFGLPITILRYGIPYGPGMWPGLLLRDWLDKARAGEPIEIIGDGNDTRPLVYIDDLAAAHILSLRQEAVNQIYHLEGPLEISSRELVDLLQREWGPIHIRYLNDSASLARQPRGRRMLSNAKARKQLGWEPKMELVEGIRRTIAWYHTMN